MDQERSRHVGDTRTVVLPRVDFAGELRRTLALAAPIIAGNLAQMLMGVVDAVMVGHLGVVPLAACSFAGNLLVIPLIFGLGFLGSVTVCVAREYGAGRLGEAGEVLRHGLALACGLGILLTGGSLGAIPLLSFFGQPADVVEESVGYYAFVALSLPLALLSVCGKNFAEALSRPWPVFCITLGAVGVNALLNWLLIFGTPISPAMGLSGAGLATFLARAASAGAVLALIRRDVVCRPCLPRSWLGRYVRVVFSTLARLGLPAGFQGVAEICGFTMAGIMMGWIGMGAIAAHQIAISCAGLTSMIPIGISHALSVRLGALGGAGMRHLLRPVTLGALLMSLGVMAISAAVLVGFGRGLARVFIADEAVVELAAGLLCIAGVFQLFDGAQATAVGGLRGLHDVRFAAVFSLVAYWGVALPLGWLLAFSFGREAAGIWWGLCVALAILAAALLARLWWLTSPSFGPAHPIQLERC